MQNNKLQIALIGCGGMGQGDAANETKLGAKLVAAADIYDGRLLRMKETYGPQIFYHARLPRSAGPARRGRGAGGHVRSLARADLY